MAASHPMSPLFPKQASSLDRTYMHIDLYILAFRYAFYAFHASFWLQVLRLQEQV